MPYLSALENDIVFKAALQMSGFTLLTFILLLAARYDYSAHCSTDALAQHFVNQNYVVPYVLKVNTKNYARQADASAVSKARYRLAVNTARVNSNTLVTTLPVNTGVSF